jgi:hypothetical protein
MKPLIIQTDFRSLIFHVVLRFYGSQASESMLKYNRS